MKVYFAKYIPETGNISVGDKIRSEGISKRAVTVIEINDEEGYYLTDELDLADPLGGWYYSVDKDKAVKLSNSLFLCYTDIQVGDTFFDQVDRKWENVESNWVEAAKDWNNVKPSFHPRESWCYKVIGKISPNATWVKEGDEFREDEIKLFQKRGRKYLIKGPCKHFH